MNYQDSNPTVVESVRDLQGKALEVVADVGLGREERFNRASELFSAAVAAGEGLRDECMVDLFVDYGSLLVSYKKDVEAEGYFERALSLCRELESAEPFVYEDRLAGVLCRLGDVHCGIEKYPGAESEYSEALAIYYRLGEKKPEEFEGKDAYVMNKLAGVHHKQGKDDEADTEYQWVRITYYGLAAEKPEKFGCLQAWNLKDLAYLHKDMGQKEAAKQEIKEAWNIISDFDKKYPGTYRLDVAKMLWSMAVLHREINNIKTAVKEYVQAVGIYKGLPEAYDMDKANILYELGILYEELGNLDDAKKVYKKVRKICDEIVRKNDDRKDEALTLLEKIKGKDLNVHVNVLGYLLIILLVLGFVFCAYHIVGAIRNYFEKPKPVTKSAVATPKKAKSDNRTGFEELFEKEDVNIATGKDSGARAAATDSGTAAEVEADVKLFILGLECYKKGDYRNAFDYFQDGAALGNASAMYYLGLMFENGNWIQRDYLKAEEWYEKAAKSGNSDASKKLSALRNNVDYLLRAGVKNYKERNYQKALYYFQKAAEQNESNAMCYLGVMCFNGYGVEKDVMKAAEWYEKSAKLGNATASTNLANLQESHEYLYSLGLRRFQTGNYAWAVDSFVKAAAKGNSDAMYYLGLIYERGYGGEKDPLKAEEWYKKAAAKGNSDARKKLSVKEKKEENKDKKGKTETIENKKEREAKAEEKNEDLKAQSAEELFRSGFEKYEKGEYSDARKLLLKAAEMNNSDAMRYLGAICLVYKDYANGVKWYERSAELKNDHAMFDLGILYQKGNDGIRDVGKAIKWYEKAGNLGNVLAMKELGNIYYYGNGVQKNYVKAREWYTKAANLGDSDSRVMLNVMNTLKHK